MRCAVTGATGYVAGELIAQLLEAGHDVAATVRCDPSEPRLDYLRDLQAKAAAAAAGSGGDVKGGGALTLLQVADLRRVTPELLAALRGAEVVFHVASPFRFDGDAREDVVLPAVEGTRAVLEAAAQVGGVRRVVVTSSVCAIHDMNRKQAPKGERYCEADWNEVSTVEGGEPYWVSKVEAERLAWRLADELKLDVVTVLPNFVLGPVRAAAQASGVSVGFLKGVLESPADKPFEGSWTINDVRDVAAAHVLAALNPDAKGRYIVSQPASVSARFVTDALKRAYPAAAAALPDGADAEATYIDSSRAVSELGLKLTPPERTVADMAASLLRFGIAAPGWWATPAA